MSISLENLQDVAVTPRRRSVWLAILAAIVGMGLASRRFATDLPDFIATYAGDTLYASAMFVLVAIVFARWPVARVAVVALAACVMIEVSQLYHAPWIDSMRATRIGGWILGFGFLWTDMVCYGIGVAAAAAAAAALTALASAGSISTRRQS